MTQLLIIVLCLHVGIITCNKRSARKADDQQKSKRIDRAYILENVPTLSMGMTSCLVCKSLVTHHCSHASFTFHSLCTT